MLRSTEASNAKESGERPGIPPEGGLRVLVLAGAANRGKLAGVASEAWEALIPVGARPMVRYVFDALAGLPGLEAVVVVGPGPLDPLLASYRFPVRRIEPSEDLVTNLRRGLEALAAGPVASTGNGAGREAVRDEGRDEGAVLVIAGDAVLVTAEVLKQFLDRCAGLVSQEGHQYEVFYPIVPREAMERLLPGTRRTYVRLKDGEFTGGNLFLLRPSVVERAGSLLGEMVAWRKKPWRMARVLGVSFLVAMAFGRLRIAAIEKVIARRLGILGRAVILPLAEIGFDVDKPADLELARRRLANGGETKKG
ncbi:MAG TPA: NTP transferase domain-containing protein [Firmicutes bacterium]|nr:NTP transferase domain-containing protein [Bacillota bacterium]